jgi:hypothetical protein
VPLLRSWYQSVLELVHDFGFGFGFGFDHYDCCSCYNSDSFSFSRYYSSRGYASLFLVFLAVRVKRICGLQLLPAQSQPDFVDLALRCDLAGKANSLNQQTGYEFVPDFFQGAQFDALAYVPLNP